MNEATAHYIRCINYSSASVPLRGADVFLSLLRVLLRGHGSGIRCRQEGAGSVPPEVFSGPALRKNLRAEIGCRCLRRHSQAGSDVSYLTFISERALFYIKKVHVKCQSSLVVVFFNNYILLCEICCYICNLRKESGEFYCVMPVIPVLV